MSDGHGGVYVSPHEIRRHECMHWEGGIIICVFLLDSVQDLVLIASSESDLSLLFLSVMAGMGNFTDRRRKWHASCA